MACAAATKDERDDDLGRIWLHVLLIIAIMAAVVVALVAELKWERRVDKRWELIKLSRSPRAYVQELYVPGLLDHDHDHNHNHNTSGLNSSIIVGLEFKRGAALPGDVAMYTDLNMHLYYGLADDPTYPVANRTVPPFRMGQSMSVDYTAVVEAPLLPWEDAFDKISAGSTVLLRLVLVGKFKPYDYRDPDYYYSNTNILDWSEFQSEAEVWVGASAHMLSNTSILFN